MIRFVKKFKIIKQTFSIKDLENLCGVKAHTIRIWEKRYNILSPDRTSTNIRSYDQKSLQRLLNVTYLVNNGFKISRISKLNENEINEYAKQIVSSHSSKNKAINSFKVSMFNYDLKLFLKIYEQLSDKMTFGQIFCNIFIPLLTEIGLLWQTSTINSAHEHFITNLIKQKVLVNIDRLQFVKSSKTCKAFILFLPEQEIHELGLLYVYYEILLRGYKTIYLGSSIPLNSLTNMLDFHESIVFVSYFTLKPDKSKLDVYLADFNSLICSKKKCEFWILGKQITGNLENNYPHYHFYGSIKELITKL